MSHDFGENTQLPRISSSSSEPLATAAALRLAPVQVTGWGHPTTSGLASIAAYLSCAPMEPPRAQESYRERLVLLPGLGTRYARPATTSRKDRAELGLPPSGTLYLCPQSLFKIHPDNDELFAQVLTQNPDAVLVFFAWRHPAIVDQFMRRLERAFARHGIAIRERTRVVPQLDHEDYLRINLACDAPLDTLHWTGGNTSLDALACGLPLVTLPGELMRGRQSAAMLTILGVPELIARDRADYLAIALRLVTDLDWRLLLAERIRAQRERLFNVPSAILRFQEILQADASPAV